MSNVYGVNPQGFILKRLADILSDYQTALAGVSDPVTGESLTPNLTDERDPLIQFINSTAAQDAQAWEQLQMLYNLLDPQSSTGAGFSGLVQLNGITRFAGTYSTVVLNLTGTPNYTMPSGAQAGTQDGTMVFNLPQVTFDSGGNAIGNGERTLDEAGPDIIRAARAAILMAVILAVCTLFLLGALINSIGI